LQPNRSQLLPCDQHWTGAIDSKRSRQGRQALRSSAQGALALKVTETLRVRKKTSTSLRWWRKRKYASSRIPADAPFGACEPQKGDANIAAAPLCYALGGRFRFDGRLMQASAVVCCDRRQSTLIEAGAGSPSRRGEAVQRLTPNNRWPAGKTATFAQDGNLELLLSMVGRMERPAAR